MDSLIQRLELSEAVERFERLERVSIWTNRVACPIQVARIQTAGMQNGAVIDDARRNESPRRKGRRP